MLKLYIMRAQPWLSSLFIWFLLSACRQSFDQTIINGQTMGTTYSVKIVNRGESNYDRDELKNQIDSLLAEVNSQMSTYIPGSEISRFNDLKSTETFPVSREFAAVVKNALEISHLTDGAFDITVGPLIVLWGFKYWNRIDQPEPPGQNAVDSLLSRIGFGNITVKNNTLNKTDPVTTIDLNAIAKGFGVDVVADWIMANGLNHFMVEIGGEVRSAGENAQHKPWQIGIDTPNLNAVPGSAINEIISLSDRALATSGDYRNYFEYAGKLYSHVIDPRTGFPVETRVASATVTAPTCMKADALATSLMVLGVDSGLKLIESLPETEALLIIREGKNSFSTVMSTGMKINQRK